MDVNLADMAPSKNSSVAEPVQVSVYPWEVAYIYTGSGLLLAYGISMLCTLVCAIVGLYAFFINDASYQNVFSTFLRAINDLDTRSHISVGDKGSDPLPKDLAKTTVTLSGRNPADDTVYSAVGKAKNDDLELQHLRPDGTETPGDRETSAGRESFDSTHSVHGAS